MHYELEAMTINSMRERIYDLETMIKDMESDFADCARGTSPCFYCLNDEECNCSYEDRDCYFVWKQHD